MPLCDHTPVWKYVRVWQFMSNWRGIYLYHSFFYVVPAMQFLYAAIVDGCSLVVQNLLQ